MGAIDSTKTTIFSHIKKEIQCPLCGYIFCKKTCFLDLNFHLNYCGAIRIFHIKTNIALNKFLQKTPEKVYSFKKPKNESKIIKDEKSNDSDIVNDLQLVIDYNEEEDLYEDYLKRKNEYSDSSKKYMELRHFLSKKKAQMNYCIHIKCNSFSEMFKALKEINIYYDNVFTFHKENCEKKNYSLNFVINKYIKTMIKLKIFEIINENILSFSFNNEKVDFEIIGVILVILLVYPEIKIKYKIPLLLFKMLLNQKISLFDIKYVNKEMYEDLYSLTKNEEISKLNLCYVYDGNELILGGKEIKINSLNILDYVEKVVNYEINKYKKYINIIKNIIYQFIPKKFIFSFNAEQLEHIINNDF